MKREEDISKLFKKSLPTPQQEQEVGKRVSYRLLWARTENSPVALDEDDDSPDPKWWPRLSIGVAATAVLASLVLGLLLMNASWKKGENLALIEFSGEPLRSGEPLQVSNPEGMTLALRDGSRIEVRSQSLLEIDRADDGLRVRLNDGSVIVTAAKQRNGHLYVETKSAIVSVIGTVFVVSAEQNGSRVGVIDGVVNVQQGGTSQKLLPGQQLATNPAMEQVPLNIQVSWSRSAGAHLALLQQASSSAPTIAADPLRQPAAIASAAARPSRPALPPQGTQPAESLFVTGAANNAAPRARPSTPETERAIEQALVSREPIPDLPFVIETNYFQQNRAEYLVPVTLKIPGTQLAASQSAKRIALDIFGRVTDDYGVSIFKLTDAIDVLLSDQTASELQTRQIVYEARFTLLPGRYSFKFVVRDADTDRVGTYETVVVIPNLSKASTSLPISSVVLSSELISLDDALSATTPSGNNPLIVEGKKLVPNARGPFSNRRDLIVFLQAYEPNSAATAPLTAFVTLYRGATKVIETRPLTIKDDLGGKWRTLPIQLRVPLTGLPASTYDCEVTVLDPSTQKTAVWRSQIGVVN